MHPLPHSLALWPLSLPLGFCLAACSSAGDQPVAGSGGADASGGQLLSSGGQLASGGSNSSESGGGPSSGGGSGGEGPASGGAPAAGGMDGSGGEGGPLLMLQEPIERSESSYVLEFGEYYFEVDPTQGGRIVHFALGGEELLLPLETTTLLNGGATFWVAPQSEWPDDGWPPLTAMDSDPFAALIDNVKIELQSASFMLTDYDLRVHKSFNANLEEESVAIRYAIENLDDQAHTQAPWEVSRHARGGITFWPQGDDDCASGVVQPSLTDGLYIWDDTAEGMPFQDDEPLLKLSCDGGGGWIAHIMGSLLFIKSWQDVPSSAQHAEDKEIQLYLGSDFVEVEMRGPYTDIPAQSMLNWDVTWMVRPAPSQRSAAALKAAVEPHLP